jgi:hypothetical protein
LSVFCSIENPRSFEQRLSISLNSIERFFLIHLVTPNQRPKIRQLNPIRRLGYCDASLSSWRHQQKGTYRTWCLIQEESFERKVLTRGLGWKVRENRKVLRPGQELPESRSVLLPHYPIKVEIQESVSSFQLVGGLCKSGLSAFGRPNRWLRFCQFISVCQTYPD